MNISPNLRHFRRHLQLYEFKWFQNFEAKPLPYHRRDTVNKKSKKGLIDLIHKILFRRSSKFDVVKMVVAGELSPEQLSLVKLAIEKGLKEKQLAELINKKISAEQMREIIEIAVLENALEEVI